VSGQDLEIVPVIREGSSAAPSRQRRWWPWAVGGAMVVIGVMAFPVRTALAHAEVDSLERAWAEVVALDSSRSTLVNRLITESVPTDKMALRQAIIALDQEEASRVAGLRRSLPLNRALDHGASGLRNAIARAIDQDLVGLHASMATLKHLDTVLLPSQLDATTVDFEAVQNQIDSQRRRFGEDLHDQHQSSAVLHAADATLAAFSHFVNVPVGVRLLVTTNFGIRLLDIDRSTDTAVDLEPNTRVAVASGSVYALSPGHVFQLPADLSGIGRDLGPGRLVFPALSGEVWITTVDNSVRLVASDGQTVWGPQPFPFGPAGSVDAGVVAAIPGTMRAAIVDPRTGRTLRTLDLGPDSPVLLVASRGEVAYTHSRDPDVHLLSVSTGVTRDYRVLASDLVEGGGGALSPDGRWLATYTVSGAGTATPVVVDLHDGSVLRLTDVTNPDPQLSMAWTPDSSRLFFTVNDDGASLATWHVGDTSAMVLRWRSATASSVVVLP
jgi:hypothetical protein